MCVTELLTKHGLHPDGAEDEVIKVYPSLLVTVAHDQRVEGLVADFDTHTVEGRAKLVAIEVARLILIKLLEDRLEDASTGCDLTSLSIQIWSPNVPDDFGHNSSNRMIFE